MLNKKIWSSPELNSYGSVEDITEAKAGGSGDTVTLSVVNGSTTTVSANNGSPQSGGSIVNINNVRVNNVRVTPR
jgi:hypothetical protein